jgi:hypothetical protein
MTAREPSRRTVSLAELARRLGLSLRQARRLWAEPREDYLNRSLSKVRPWIDQGVSRATWYRRRRKAARPDAADEARAERQASDFIPPEPPSKT